MKKGGTQLAREEWDFDTNQDSTKQGYAGCPDDELIYCFEYEFYRTSRVPLVAYGKPWLPHESPALQKFYEVFLFDEVENLLPWLSLDKNDRRRKLDKVRKYAISTPSPLRQVGVSALKQDDIYHDSIQSMWFDDDDLNAVTVQPLAIAWRYSNEVIVEEFRRWLTDTRYKLGSDVERRGKNSSVVLRSALKALGASRLLEGMKIKETIEYTKSILVTGPLFQGEESWSRAKKISKSLVEARSDKWLEKTLLKTFKDSKPKRAEVKLVENYLKGEFRSVLLRLVALSPSMILKRAQLSQIFLNSSKS